MALVEESIHGTCLPLHPVILRRVIDGLNSIQDPIAHLYGLSVAQDSLKDFSV